MINETEINQEHTMHTMHATHPTIKQTTQLKLLDNFTIYMGRKVCCKYIWADKSFANVNTQSLLEDHSERSLRGTLRENTLERTQEITPDRTREETTGRTPEIT